MEDSFLFRTLLAWSWWHYVLWNCWEVITVWCSVISQTHRLLNSLLQKF